MNINFEKPCYFLNEPICLSLEAHVSTKDLEASLKITYISDVIKTPLNFPLKIISLVNNKKNPLSLLFLKDKTPSLQDNRILYKIKIKFPEEIPSIIAMDRNMLNNFGVIQLEAGKDLIIRNLMIFTEENKEIKVILVS